LLAAALILQALASRNPSLVERFYSRTAFPGISYLLSLINGVVGFSIAEFMIYFLLAALVGALISQARAIYLRRKRVVAVLGTDLLALLWLLGSLALLFLLIWGLNYQRESLGSQLGLTARNASEDQLKTISETIVNEVNSNYTASRSQVATDGSRPGSVSRAEIYNLIETAYQNAPLLAAGGGRYGPPKPVYFSGLMSRLGLSGFYMPFSGEPNFNAAQPDFDLPYVIAHEKAHQRGFAREDEANFIAFLVCVNSTHPFLRYSGYLNVLRVVGAFGDSDPDFYQNLYARIGEGPRNDIEARAAFWARYEGPARGVAEKLNNTYLRSNRIASGTQSYSEDGVLIVAYYLMREKNERKFEQEERAQ
jgi:hypothetical protein